jgi:hypothetical protein
MNPTPGVTGLSDTTFSKQRRRSRHPPSSFDSAQDDVEVSARFERSWSGSDGFLDKLGMTVGRLGMMVGGARKDGGRARHDELAGSPSSAVRSRNRTSARLSHEPRDWSESSI